ncbi:HWE histidine kinase domain-containing protein [Roseomonas sp. E05]|uniref:HWE histidine kinase domain-containing protein n=1 Tax=Roseomonas sp. E05 TaxID=3046310 RepID=UPI0024BA1CA1|nr:HWE histidine kinase domain-containing protein [Roseomonas sp. E05]MDJ0388395.1 HWE histidine kinase domain-containing protein [Roseomonas sp. E05]
MPPPLPAPERTEAATRQSRNGSVARASGLATEPDPLEAALITHELGRRTARAPDHQAENRALGILAQEIASSPGTVLRTLSELVMELCGADSAGVSILSADGSAFGWPAMAGPFARNAGGSMPREASPCGLVIRREAILLFDQPHRCFPALARCEPPIFENLLAPFPVQGVLRGTVWAIAHRPERHFDGEDARLLSALSRFAAAGYQMGCALREAEAARTELERRVEEEVRAKSALRTAHDHTTEVLESLPEAFYAVDRDWRFTYVNRQAEERWGKHRGELLGRTLWEVFPQMIGGRAEPSLRRVMHERRPARVETLSIAYNHWAEMSIHPTAAGGLSVYLCNIEERKRAEEQQALMAREMDHRAKNTLTVVQATLRMTRADSVESYVAAVEGRVAALARVQSLLAAERWSGTDLRALLQAELEPFLPGDGARPPCGEPRVRLDGPPVALTARLAQPLSMAVHELATNAMKHGALCAVTGRVCVSWGLEGPENRTLRLRWEEAGGPALAGPPGRRGFGSRVLETTIRRQIGGSVALAWEAGGLACDFALPLDGPAGSAA